MDIKEYFERFWETRADYLHINNRSRTQKNLIKKLSSFNEVYQIDDYVCSLRTEKESTREIMVAFFDYLKYEEGIEVSSILYNKKFYDYPIERRLEMAKFLHEPRTIDEIESRFDICDRTRREDLQALEDGIEVLGSTIKITKVKRNRKYYYKSTMHPVFLALNLSEVNVMTDYLGYMAKETNSIYSEILIDIVNRIKAQLSSYAFNKFFSGEEQPKENYYLDEEALAKQREKALAYLYKSGIHFKFIYKDYEYGGYLKETYNGLEIVLDDGTVLSAKSDEIEVLLDSYEYE